MTIEKEKGVLVLIALIMLLNTIFIHGYIIFKGGISELALEIHLYATPVSALLTLLSTSILRSARKVIVLNNEGLLVEDFSSKPIPWQSIKEASFKKQRLPRGGECHWLVLQTTDNSRYLSKKIQKLNKRIGLNGVTICNLANYQVQPSEILKSIQETIKSSLTSRSI